MRNEKGQTSVEYILLLVVLVVVSAGIFKKIQAYMITNPDSQLNVAINSLNFSSFGPNFKRFGIRR